MHNASDISIDSRKKYGQQGEDAVSNWLKKKSFVISKRNFRTRTGEIDIIATKGNLIAFVEVKTRMQDYFNLSEVIVISKQRKIIKTAHFYIACQKSNLDMIYRFDVALVQINVTGKCRITYIENAFTQHDY